MHLKKKIKKKIAWGILILLVFFFVYFFRIKEYEIQYQLHDITVTERYNKEEKMYQFAFQYKDILYVENVTQKQKSRKKLVTDIEVKTKEEETCLLIKGKIDFYPVCSRNKELLSYHLVNPDLLGEEYFKEPEQKEENYSNMTLYDLNKRTFFLWNYKGFHIINAKNKQTVHIFNSDVYSTPLTIKVKDILLFADYERKYEFDTFYVLNSKGKVRKLVLDKKVSFESYFLGVNQKYAYLIDKKNKREYEIYPKKLLSRNIEKDGLGVLYKDGRKETVTLNSLVTTEQSFVYENNGEYKIENQILYYYTNGTKVKISDQEVKAIIENFGLEVYYLVGDTLYCYYPFTGEKKIMKNFEWNFNYKNMIYIF